MGTKGKKYYPLRWSMIGMLVMGWLLPLMVITFILLYFVSSMISGQIEKTILISTDKAAEICDSQLEAILTASKTATYNRTIKDSYVSYKRNGFIGFLKNEVTIFLDQQYKYDQNFLCTMVFFMESPDDICYTYNTYRENNDGIDGFTRTVNFRNQAQAEIMEMSGELDTSSKLVMISGRLYMIRNLVESDFSPYAMIVIELSPKPVFESLNSIWGAVEYEVFVDGQPILETGCGEGANLDDIRKETKYHSGYSNSGGEAYAYRTTYFEGQEVIYYVKLDSKALIDDVSMLRALFILVLVFMIPLVVLVFHFFHRKVARPVASLVDASREITAGNYGHQVEICGNSREFEYLDNAFNNMSIELKYQFEQIYLEELALKDANIMALQSQINPHFLNNTLEIINWEARMNGNEKVSGMIEALATMLEATMNRKQKRFVPLSEELEYVEAYLYIIRQRFGSRFQSDRQVDESLLDVEVPLLIIQPIIENAVEHGMNGSKSGQVNLHIYARMDKMYIEVINDGALRPEDEARIAYLLGDDVQDENEHHVSLGIRNVDRRLKIIYGDDCGLNIKSNNENKTVSTIIVKIAKESNIIQ